MFNQVGFGLLLSVMLVLVGLAFVAGVRVRARRDRPATARSTDLTRVATDGGSEISLVMAIVRPERLHDVKQTLAEVGAPSLTVTTVSGRGSQPAETGQWRGEEYIVDLHQKIKVECVVADVPAEDVVDAVRDAAHTGQAGDGKIFVLPVEAACQIRTGARGAAAI